METFSLLKVETDTEAQIDICHFTSKYKDHMKSWQSVDTKESLAQLLFTEMKVRLMWKRK